MPSKRTRIWIAGIVALVFYLFVLAGGLTESTRRSIQVVDDTTAPDRVLVSIVVTSVNPAAQELTAQLGFRVAGSIAKDDVTPAVDLQLLANNVRGEQEFDFPKGKRMNRVEVVVPLNGELNKYPFDRYATTVWLLMTTPARNAQRQAPKASATVPTATEPAAAPTPTGQIEELAVSASALERSTPVALSVSVSASIPGIHFKGNVTRGSPQDPTGAVLNLSRATSVIQVSLLVMAMMAALSFSLLAMVVRATMAQKSDLLPLSVSISLIFGLPALRNIQPGVPPVGALVDYIAFVWAELIVAVSAVIVVWTWILRLRRES